MQPTTQNNSWYPNPGQQEFMLMQPDNTFEILYGGARGGGKTDAGLVWMLDHVNNPRYRGLVIRKNANDLVDWIDRARRMYMSSRAKIAGNPVVITFPTGAKIYTGHLNDDNAYTKYQGQEYQRILIEELTQIPKEKNYVDLISSCRSTVEGIQAQVLSTTNPGGIGHGWVKDRFVDASPPNKRFMSKLGRLAIFIPATMDDNPILMKADPGYVKTIESYKDIDIDRYKAWRYGDWDVFAGQVFREFKRTKDGKPYHVRRYVPESVLDVCTKVIGFDWGWNDMAAAVWLAITPEDKYGVKHIFAYREIYMNETTPEMWAEAILQHTRNEPISYVAMPHDTFGNKTTNRSIADTFRDAGLSIRAVPSLNRGARINRVAILHQMLSESPNGRPYMQITENCVVGIKQIPELPYDDNNPEDVDTNAEDHWYDACTYALLLITNGKSWIVQAKQPVSNKNKGYMAVDGGLEGFNIDLKGAMTASTKQQQDWRSK
jgi:PBSX family phage terminase large subunit